MNKDEAREAAVNETARLMVRDSTRGSRKQILEALYDAGAASVDRRAIAGLLKERLRDHSYPDSGEYNGCDDSPCNWCERALKIIAEMGGDDEQV